MLYPQPISSIGKCLKRGSVTVDSIACCTTSCLPSPLGLKDWYTWQHNQVLRIIVTAIETNVTKNNQGSSLERMHMKAELYFTKELKRALNGWVLWAEGPFKCTTGMSLLGELGGTFRQEILKFKLLEMRFPPFWG